MKVFLTFLVLAVSAYSANAIFSTGSCYDVPAIPNFSIPKYLGTWYEIQRKNSVFERKLKCGKAIYNLEEGSSISVVNSGLNVDSGAEVSITGKATVIVEGENNKLNLQLPIQIAGMTVFENEGEYSILKTDYDNYALIYSCKQIIPNFVKSEVSWVLSRKRTLEAEFVNQIIPTLSSVGLSLDTFEVVDQEGC